MNSLLENHLVLWDWSSRLGPSKDAIVEREFDQSTSCLLITPKPAFYEKIVDLVARKTIEASTLIDVYAGETWLGPLSLQCIEDKKIALPSVFFIPSHLQTEHLTIDFRSQRTRFRSIKILDASKSADCPRSEVITELQHVDGQNVRQPQSFQVNLPPYQILEDAHIDREFSDQLTSVTAYACRTGTTFEPDQVGPATTVLLNKRPQKGFDVSIDVIPAPDQAGTRILPLPFGGLSVCVIRIEYKATTRLDDVLDSLINSLLHARFMMAHRNRVFAQDMTASRAFRSIAPHAEVAGSQYTTKPLLSRWDDFRLFQRAAIAQNDEFKNSVFPELFEPEAFKVAPGALARSDEGKPVAEELAQHFFEWVGSDAKVAENARRHNHALANRSPEENEKRKFQLRATADALLDRHAEFLFDPDPAEPSELARKITKFLITSTENYRSLHILNMSLSPLRFQAGDFVTVQGQPASEDYVRFQLSDTPNDAFEFAALLSWCAAIVGEDQDLDHDDSTMKKDMKRQAEIFRGRGYDQETQYSQRSGYWFSTRGTQKIQSRLARVLESKFPLSFSALALRDVHAEGHAFSSANRQPDQEWRVNTEWFAPRPEGLSGPQSRNLDQPDPLKWSVGGDKPAGAAGAYGAFSPTPVYKTFLESPENTRAKLRADLLAWYEMGFPFVITSDEILLGQVARIGQMDLTGLVTAALRDPTFRAGSAEPNMDRASVCHYLLNKTPKDLADALVASSAPPLDTVVAMARFSEQLNADNTTLRELSSRAPSILGRDPASFAVSKPAGLSDLLKTSGLAAFVWQDPASRPLVFFAALEKPLRPKYGDLFADTVFKYLLADATPFTADRLFTCLKASKRRQNAWNGPSRAPRRKVLFTDPLVNELGIPTAAFSRDLDPLITVVQNAGAHHYAGLALDPDHVLSLFEMILALTLAPAAAKILGGNAKNPTPEKILNGLLLPERTAWASWLNGKDERG